MTFTVNYLRVVVGVAFGLMAVAMLPGVGNGGRGGLGLQVFAGAFVAGTTVLAIRGARSATIIAAADGVTYRSFLRTRRWPWGSIDRFTTADASIGLYVRHTLFLHERNGHVHKLSEINTRVSRPGKVDDAARQLNARCGTS